MLFETSCMSHPSLYFSSLWSTNNRYNKNRAFLPSTYASHPQLIIISEQQFSTAFHSTNNSPIYMQKDSAYFISQQHVRPFGIFAKPAVWRWWQMGGQRETRHDKDGERERVGKMPKQVHHISEEHLRDLLMIICSNSTSPAVSDRCSNIRRILDLNECVSLQTVEIHTHQGKLLANYRKDSQNGLTSSEYLK